MDYRAPIQKLIYRFIDPFIDLLLRMGITPNAVTAAGLAGNAVAAWFLVAAGEQTVQRHDVYCGRVPAPAYLLLFLAGAFILFSGLFDMLDGRLARKGNLSSRFGALFDSVLDRYSELLTLSAVAFLFACEDRGETWPLAATMAAGVGSVMVSYVRARSEALGYECKVGLMQRPERVVLTALALIVSGCMDETWPLAWTMALMALLTNVTAVWRLIHCMRQNPQ